METVDFQVTSIIIIFPSHWWKNMRVSYIPFEFLSFKLADLKKNVLVAVIYLFTLVYILIWISIIRPFERKYFC